MANFLTLLILMAVVFFVTLVVSALILWLAWFIEDLDIEFPNPIEAIADHAERTADIVSEILERKRRK